MTPVHLLWMSQSLKISRRFDALSARIRFAMNLKSIVPVVEINTPSGKVTLVNAKILGIALPVPRARPKRGAGTKGLDTHELEEIEFTFQTITHTGKVGHKADLDNWAIGG